MKSELRRFFLNLRREMEEGEIKQISDIIFERLIDLDLYKNSKSIFVYVALDKEIQTQKIIDHALKTGKEVYVPHLSNKIMTANKLESLDELVEGSFGIRTTPSEISISNPDLSLVPGLSFDSHKNRLGYGGGYYDNFLKKADTISVGLFADIFKSVNIPVFDYDIKLDYILTEKVFI